MCNIIKKNLKIEGMHCTSCAMNIDFDLEDIEGVKSAKTNYAKQVCVVEYDGKKVSEEELLKSIKKTGYKAVIL
jgi:Cu+-exporting ATPase